MPQARLLMQTILVCQHLTPTRLRSFLPNSVAATHLLPQPFQISITPFHPLFLCLSLPPNHRLNRRPKARHALPLATRTGLVLVLPHPRWCPTPRSTMSLLVKCANVRRRLVNASGSG